MPRPTGTMPIEIRKALGYDSKDKVSGSTKLGCMLAPEIARETPIAYWLDNPHLFTKERFIEETSNFLWVNYNLGSAQDQHLVAMIAQHLECYISMMADVQRDGPMAENRFGVMDRHPSLKAAQDTLPLILKMMNEVGITPRGRLEGSRNDAARTVEDFLAGPDLTQ